MNRIAFGLCVCFLGVLISGDHVAGKGDEGMKEHSEYLPIASQVDKAEKVTSPLSSPAPKEVPGVTIAKTVNEATGLAMSPLLVSGLLGAYRYYSVPPAQRNTLPWYASLHFWVTTLAIGLLFTFNGLIGSWIPFLSKPMNAVEHIEHKVTALFVAIPIIASRLGWDLSGVMAHPVLSAFAQKPDIVLAGASLDSATIILYLLAFVFILIGFFLVWLFSQALNTLILLSPFPLVDWMISVVKHGLIGLVLVSAVVNPYFGLAVSLVIIVFSWCISGWCFRFMVFGTVFAWDILTAGHKRFVPRELKIKAFTSCKMSGVPKRTYGNMARNKDGDLVFIYRPWLVFSSRLITLGPAEYAIEKGLLYPSMLFITGGKGTHNKLFAFPPHCKNHETHIGEMLSTVTVLETASMRGFKAAVQWLRDVFSRDGVQWGGTTGTCSPPST